MPKAKAKPKKVPAEQVEETGAAEGEKKEKKGRPVLIILLVIVPFLLLGAAGAYFFLFAGMELPFELPFQGSEAEEEAEPPVGELPRYIYAMREFQVNLADAGTRRFLRVTMDIAYSEKALTREFENRESELRSNIISILRSKHTHELDEPGGMKSLEEELIERLNSLLNSGAVEAIYYKEFIFQ